MPIDWNMIIEKALRNQRDNPDYNRPLGNPNVPVPPGGFPGGRAKTKNESIFGPIVRASSDLVGLGKGIKDNVFQLPFGLGSLPPPRTGGVGTVDPNAPQFNSSLGQVAGAAQDNSSTDIMTQLVNALSGSNSLGYDPSQLEAQARAAASAQFDPQIAAIQRAMDAAQTRAGRNKTELGNMFNSLSDSYNADIPAIDANYNKGKADVTAQYKQMQSDVAKQYADANQQQQDLMKQLNLQAAAPDILAKQNTDQAFFQNQQNQSQKDTLDSLQMLQSGATDYARQGADVSRLEGTQRQADLITQLNDYLGQATGQIGDLNTQKANAFQSDLSGLTQQAQQFAYQQQQDQFQKLLDIAKLQQQQQQIDSQGTTQYKQGPLAAAQYLSQTAPSNATQLNGALLDILQSPEITSGRTGSLLGESVPLTPEAAASLAQKKAQQMGLDPQSQKELYLAMLAYYGRNS